MFEVSLRTIYRDIDAINMAGIPVRGTSGVNGGFEIMPEYKLDKRFSQLRISPLILMGLSSLSNMIHGDELINALAKVKSFIPADRAKDIALKANQIFIDLSPWMGNRNMQPYLENQSCPAGKPAAFFLNMQTVTAIKQPAQPNRISLY